MKKLVQLRNDESIKAERAATKLRTAVNKLQMRYECEKQQLHDTLRFVGESTGTEISHLKTLLRQIELDREQLQNKLKSSDANTAQLNEEIARFKSEASQFASRLSQLLNTNSELSSNLTKLKSAHQKASARAEAAAKQIEDLRKQLNQANLVASQAEQRMRTANERRIAAESALSAVRQRADVQAQRSSQLEREVATEKARLHEKCQLHEADMQKLRRRLLALQSEAAKWKKVYQAEKAAGDERVNHANKLLQSTLDTRTRLEMDLKASLSREADNARLIDQLRQQAVVDATDASSRLFVALSTGEEGVTTALELKRCIEDQLQPELQNTKRLYREAVAECEGWREKHGKLNADLDACREVVKELEDRLSGLQASTDKELASLKLDLERAECDNQLKSALLAKSEEQSLKFGSDISRLRTTLDQFRSVTDEQLDRLNARIDKLRLAHESTSLRLRSAQKSCVRHRSVRDATLAELAKVRMELKEARDSHEMVQRLKLEELNNIKLEMTSVEGKLARAETELQRLRHDSAKQLLTNSEEYEHVIDQLKQQLATELHNVDCMQHRMSHLCAELTESNSKLTSVVASRLSLQTKCEGLENKVRELEAQLHLRCHELAITDNGTLKRTHSPDSREHQLRDSEATVVDSRWPADCPRTHQAEQDCEKQLLEQRTNAAEGSLKQCEHERNKLCSQLLELQRTLEQRKHAQVEHSTQCSMGDVCAHEDLLKQLTEAHLQRDRACENLAEAQHRLREEVASKQALLDRMKEIEDHSCEIQATLKNELQDSRRDCASLQQRIDHFCIELQKSESRIRETEDRAALAEVRQKKAVHKAEQLVLELATQRAVSEATESAFSCLNSQSMGSLLPFLKGGEFPHLPPATNSCSQPQNQDDKTVPGRRKVTFAPPPLNNGLVAQQGHSSAARDLEALIREVTLSLDNENTQE